MYLIFIEMGTRVKTGRQEARQETSKCHQMQCKTCSEVNGFKIYILWPKQLAIEYNTEDEEKRIPGLGIGKTKTKPLWKLNHVRKL